LNTQLELFLSFQSCPKSASQLLKCRWVDKQEVSFNCLLVNLDCSLNIYLNYRDLPLLLYPFNICKCSTIEISMYITPFYEFVLFNSLYNKFQILGIIKFTLIKSSLVTKW
jgi:hypothetical protein